MAYTNSPLVSYTRISPNRTKNRNHAIDTITIHCVVGQCSVETLGNILHRRADRHHATMALARMAESACIVRRKTAPGVLPMQPMTTVPLQLK